METNQYVIVDLEMCRVPFSKKTEQYPCRNEIIEIGAVLVNEKLETVDTFKTYVAPEFGVLDDYIQKLTGITNYDLENAPTLCKALERFTEWLPENAILVSWSDNDEYQMSEEIYYKYIDIPELEKCFDNWEDCQREFGQRMKTSKVYKLSEALAIADLEYDENIHDALVDARNTALLFIKMKNEPVLKLSPYYSTGTDSNTLTFKPFANLFAKCGCVINQ